MLDKLYDDRLEGLITDDKYRQKHEEFSQAQQKHEESLRRLELLDSKQLDDYSHLLELANKAPELFKKSDFEEKRKLIKKYVRTCC